MAQRKEVVIPVRVTRSTRAAIRRLARRRNADVSSIVRGLIDEELADDARSVAPSGDSSAIDSGDSDVGAAA